MQTQPTGGYLTCPRCEGLYAQGRTCPCDSMLYPRWLRALAWSGLLLFCGLAWYGVALLAGYGLALLGGW